MAIIPPNPFTLENGEVADATEVMADLNNLRDNINANCAKSGVNNDITALTALSTPLSVAQGGTGLSSAGTSGYVVTSDGSGFVMAAPSAALAYRGCVVQKPNGSGQAISAGGHVVAEFSTTIIDTDSIHSDTINNSRLTVPSGITKVRFFANVNFSSGSQAIITIRLYKNGAPFSYGAFGYMSQIWITAAQTNFELMEPTLSLAIACSPGDYFELVLDSSSPAVNSTLQPFTMFEMQLLG